MTPKYPDVVLNYTPIGSVHFEALRLFRQAQIACREAGYSTEGFCDAGNDSLMAGFDATCEYVSKWVTLTVSKP